jgi:hypothetical protein
LLHVGDGESWRRNPLEGASGGDDVELRAKAQAGAIADLELQIRERRMCGSRHVEELGVAIEADDAPQRPNSFGNARGNRACAAADVEDRDPRLQKAGQPAVISFEGSPS